ncbi:hypothetical protein [Catellatospora methionotrophica]|uniref:hypothetical protein n=1 Tax=Catellatospora methionotrophica TaxID=121620 RepID=UPI00140920DD|nr:hypothetical protein [Catellatospora methionotrophica]
MSIGQGMLRVTLAYPSLTRRYRTSTPQLSVDGVDQLVEGWGTHTLAVAAGPHRIAVRLVPPRGEPFGQAEASAVVELGGQTAVDYRASRFHRRGRITIARTV